jgi:hypothetical protein
MSTMNTEPEPIIIRWASEVKPRPGEVLSPLLFSLINVLSYLAAALALPLAASVMRSATFCGSCSMATWQVGIEIATPPAFFAPASSIAGLSV